jgi:hypothetical protein
LYSFSRSYKFEYLAAQQKNQIIFGVPWNTSQTAMVKLACLESAKCRNLLLKAAFVKDRLYQEENSNPTTVRMKELEREQGSLIHFWLQKNNLIDRLRGAEVGLGLN